MYIASAVLDNDQQLLILGISRRNLELMLEQGKPMDISRESHGIVVPDKLKIVIFAGETEAAMHEQMKALIGPDTVIGQKKPQ